VSLHRIVCYALAAYVLILLLRAVFSWIPVDPQSPLQKVNTFCFRATEPILAPVRGLIPVVQLGGVGIDISFMLVFFVLIIGWQVFCGGVV
jgi:YggT family protein